MLRSKALKLRTRLLPLQVLGKAATSTAFRGKSALRMLSLEGDIDVIRMRTKSMLSDMGVEASIWNLPNIMSENPGEKCFAKMMPLGDVDHMLHLTMSEGEDAFARGNPMWESFQSQVQALSKVFSKRDHVEQYMQKNIVANDNVPAHSKRALMSLFNLCCPTYVVTRWHYGFDVLHWISRREQLINFLEPTSSEDMSAAEADSLRKLSTSEESRLQFWAVLYSYYILQQWGFEVYTFMHSCPCPEHASLPKEDKRRAGCIFVGRRMIEMADGACSEFIARLESLVPQKDQNAARALRALERCNPEAANVVTRSFLAAKAALLVRFSQGTSFYGKYPWCMPRLLRFVLAPCGSEARQAAVERSREFACELLDLFQQGKIQSNTFADDFFEESFRESLRRWASGRDAEMNPDLYRELLTYGVEPCGNAEAGVQAPLGAPNCFPSTRRNCSVLLGKPAPQAQWRCLGEDFS